MLSTWMDRNDDGRSNNQSNKRRFMKIPYHWIIVYEMKGGETMRQSLWFTPSAPRDFLDHRGRIVEPDTKKVQAEFDNQVRKEFARRNKTKKIVGVYPHHIAKGMRPFFIDYANGDVATINAKTGAEAITLAYNKKKMPVVRCYIAQREGRIEYDVPKRQEVSVKTPTLKQKNKQAVSGTGEFDFMKWVDAECNKKG